MWSRPVTPGPNRALPLHGILAVDRWSNGDRVLRGVRPGQAREVSWSACRDWPAVHRYAPSLFRSAGVLHRHARRRQEVTARMTSDEAALQLRTADTLGVPDGPGRSQAFLEAL